MKWGMISAWTSLSLKQHAEYKTSFIILVLNQVLLMAAWLFFWKVMLNTIGNFGAWNFEMMVILTGFVNIHIGLWVLFVSIWRLPQEIVRGKFNRYLVQPLHPLINFIGRRLNLSSLGRIGIGVVLLIYASLFFDMPFSPLLFFLALFIAVLSVLIGYLPFTIITLLSFWWGKADFVRNLFAELFPFENYPLTEFPMGFEFFFTYLVPYIFVGTIPTLVLLEFTLAQTFTWIGIGIALLLVQYLVFTIVWKRGLRRYESYGG